MWEDTLIGFMMVDDDGQDLIQDMRNYTHFTCMAG